MKLSELAMVAAVAVSVSGVSYAAFNITGVTGVSAKASQEVSCHTVDGAIVAYVAKHGTPPASTGDLKPYVKGDISAYRIVQGQAAGPGC